MPDPRGLAGRRPVTTPLCSVITPTWGRNSLLFSRCIPSVQAQDYPAVEHVIVSDGPDPELRAVLAGALTGDCQGRRHPLRYYELGEHDPEPHYGHHARIRGLELAAGEYVTYCDDDDALRPDHCSLMAAALDADPDAGFAVSRMVSHGPDGSLLEIGWGPLACGNVGTPMICHRRGTLRHGTWGPPSALEDWELAERWLAAGVPYVNVDAETSDVWPSVFR